MHGAVRIEMFAPYGHKAAINNKNSHVRCRHANAGRIGVADVSEAGFIPAKRGVWGEAPIRKKATKRGEGGR